MKNSKMQIGKITEAVMALCGVLILIGINTWFMTCGPKDDGSWMSCHWAGQMIKALSVVMVVLAAVHFASKDDKVRMGIDISLVLIALLTALTPGRLINLCMMEDMMCHTHTAPWTIALSIVIVIAAVLDIIYRYQARDREAHKRNDTLTS